MAELRKGRGLRQSMAWLHTWSGLLVCWVLFLVFCGGTASLLKDEITLWMKPELHARLGGDTSAAATRQAADGAIAFLRQQARECRALVHQSARRPSSTTSVFWLRQPRPEDAGKGNRARLETRTLDAVTGNPVPGARETRGGEFLYRLHFDLHYMSAIWARWIIGFCTMFMLVAILSGVITHRRIFADFFTFRARKGQRSWLDAHNATAVLALPFHLMITYTGLVTLLFIAHALGHAGGLQGRHEAVRRRTWPPRATRAGVRRAGAAGPGGPDAGAGDRPVGWRGPGADYRGAPQRRQRHRHDDARCRAQPVVGAAHRRVRRHHRRAQGSLRRGSGQCQRRAA